MADLTLRDADYRPITIDPVAITDGYISQLSWRCRENSTSTYSIGALVLHQASSVASQYWLHKVYTPDIAAAHKNCDLHLHDLQIIASYCAGWNIRTLLEEGLGIRGKVNSGPAKHLNSAMQQIVNYLGIMQLEWNGAQAFSSFDTYLAPFIRIDKMSYDDVKQCMQTFLFGVNTPSRWGGQSPFSNVTLDVLVPDDMKDQYPVIGGKKQSFTYSELQPEIDLFNKAFFDVFNKGDYNEGMFQYPIVTFNCTKDFFEKINPEVEEKLYTITAKYGVPYFSNYVSTGADPSETRSMCCRLRLDLTQLTRKNGSLFGSGENTGSIGVVTINMPKIGYSSHSEEDLIDRLNAMMMLAKESLELKRTALTKWLEGGLYPYTKRYLPAGYANHFSTIGVVGFNEMCRNFFRNTKKKDHDISTKEGKALTMRVLDYMRQRCSDFQVETGNLYNLEATPAESTCFRLAKHDRQKFPDIICAGTAAAPYYTNSSNLPVGFTDDPWEMLTHQTPLQEKYTGGCVAHLYLSESVDDWTKVRDTVKKIMYNSKIPYITITPTFSVCEVHGFIKGDAKGVCPMCLAEARGEYEKKLSDLQQKKEALLAEVESDACCES
jgi:ribonucleoside-triphosphate reductase